MTSHSNHAPNEFRTSSPTDNRSSFRFPSKFKEHLSIDVPHPDLQLEHSHFSPDSPPPPVPPLHRASSSTHSNQRSTYSFGSSTMFSPRSKAQDLEKADDPPIMEVPLDDRSRLATPSPRRESGWGIRDRFTKFLFDAKSLKKEHSEPDFGIAMQETVQMEQWAPLNIEKRNPPTYAQQEQDQHLPRCTCCPHHHDHQKKQQEGTLKKWRRKFLIFLGLLFLLWVFANLVALDAKVLSPGTSSSSSSGSGTTTASAPSASSSSSSTLSAAVQECITEYTVNAPNSPTTYPCSTCLPLLSALPSSVTDENPAALEATQFCALRALWEDSDSTGQSGLENGGWVEDVKFCSWSGVTCDGSSRVSSLELTTPAVPASIPVEFGNLTALSSLQIIGDGTIPGGSIPNSFLSLSSLTSLHLESTALTALPNDTLANSNLTTLVLVKNTQMGSSLPTTLGAMPLTQLIVTNETLTLTADQETNICGRTLSTCDLQGTGISSCGSCVVG